MRTCCQTHFGSMAHMFRKTNRGLTEAFQPTGARRSTLAFVIRSRAGTGG